MSLWYIYVKIRIFVLSQNEPLIFKERAEPLSQSQQPLLHRYGAIFKQPRSTLFTLNKTASRHPTLCLFFGVFVLFLF